MPFSELLQDGDSVAMEGFTHLIPFAAGHEMIRQKIRKLTLIRMAPGLIYDQMIEAGGARKLEFSRGGNPGVGSLHRMRDAVERGWPNPVEVEQAKSVVGYIAGQCARFRSFALLSSGSLLHLHCSETPAKTCARLL